LKKWISGQDIEGKEYITSFNGVCMSDIQLLLTGFLAGQKQPEKIPLPKRPPEEGVLVLAKFPADG